MKRILFLAATFLMMSASAVMAQKNQKNDKSQTNGDRRYSQMATNIANQLMLDDAKSAEFVPLYVEYRKELKQIAEKYSMAPAQKDKDSKDKDAAKKGPRQWTDKDLEQMNANRFARIRATIDVEEKYYKRFQKVLSERQYSQMQRIGKMNMQRMGAAGRNPRMGNGFQNGRFGARPGAGFGNRPGMRQGISAQVRPNMRPVTQSGVRPGNKSQNKGDEKSATAAPHQSVL